MANLTKDELVERLVSVFAEAAATEDIDEAVSRAKTMLLARKAMRRAEHPDSWEHAKRIDAIFAQTSRW